MYHTKHVHWFQSWKVLLNLPKSRSNDRWDLFQKVATTSFAMIMVPWESERLQVPRERLLVVTYVRWWQWSWIFDDSRYTTFKKGNWYFVARNGKYLSFIESSYSFLSEIEVCAFAEMDVGCIWSSRWPFCCWGCWGPWGFLPLTQTLQLSHNPGMKNRWPFPDLWPFGLIPFFNCGAGFLNFPISIFKSLAAFKTLRIRFRNLAREYLVLVVELLDLEEVFLVDLNFWIGTPILRRFRFPEHVHWHSFFFL